MKSKVWNVPIGELLDCYGVVAEDVLSREGALILPSGIALLALRETRPEVVSNLLRHGITHVKVKNEPQITAGEFRNALGMITPKIAEFNPLIAQLAVHQFAVIYSNIDDKAMREHGINSLLNISSRFLPELRGTSQITLSMVSENLDNEWIHSHSLNVALLSGYLAQKLFPMSSEFVEAVIFGGLFHDIGKAFLPGVLRRSGGAGAAGERILRCHPLLGETLLKDVGIFSEDILGAVRSHHEKWKGGGAPDNLIGEAIPVAARIVAVASTFENFASRSEDIDSRRCDQALTSVIGITQTDFDQRVVRILLSSIGLYPPGSVVQLSDSRIGIVLETKERNLVCPRVLIWSDDKGKRSPSLEVLNINRESRVYVKEVLDDFSRRELAEYKAQEPLMPPVQRILVRSKVI